MGQILLIQYDGDPGWLESGAIGYSPLCLDYLPI